MPRNGSGVYSKPAGTTAVADTLIESAKYNQTIDDLVADANEARPITAGGTGGVTAIAGCDNLSTKGADIASATTTDIGAATGRYVNITGTTTITGLGTKTAGVVRICTFTGALTLTHNATSLILPGAASITTAAGDVAVFVSEGSGNWRCVSYTKANGLNLALSSELYRGQLNGLTLSNNAVDATNDIDIATGSAGSDGTTPVLMTLSSAITKRLDAAWAVGSGNGGLDTGAIANGTYHVWLIRRSDTGVVDSLFSASATSPTMPTNYDQKRRIGSIIRSAGAILAFRQNGDSFNLDTPVTDRNSTAAAAAALVTLTVPTGIKVSPKITNSITINAAGNMFTSVGDGDGASAVFIIVTGQSASQSVAGSITGAVFTNTSGQIRYTVVIGGSLTSNTLNTVGWVDTRGR